MPGKTQGDRLLDVEQAVAGLTVRVQYFSEELNTLKASHAAAMAEAQQGRREVVALQQHVDEMRRLIATASAAEIAVLQEKVAKLESSRGKAGDRAWSVVPTLLSVVVSGAISAAVAYFITRPGK